MLRIRDSVATAKGSWLWRSFGWRLFAWNDSLGRSSHPEARFLHRLQLARTHFDLLRH